MHSKMSAAIFRSFGGNTAALYFGISVAISAVILLAVVTLMLLRHEAELRIAITTQNLARSIELMIDGLVDKIDIAGSSLFHVGSLSSSFPATR